MVAKQLYSFVSGMYAIGSVSGPIVGGAFAQDGRLLRRLIVGCMLTDYFVASWRWIFWINLPIIGIGYVMVALFLKLQHTKSAPFLQQLKRVDWFGSVLFIASTTSVLIPVSWVRSNPL
jgi:MFS family permease